MKIYKVMAILMVLTMASSTLFGQDVQSDYYKEGQVAAERDYTGRGAMIGGVVGGSIIGLVGWGIAYKIVTNGNIKVPCHHTSTYDELHKNQFVNGYTDHIDKTRKKMVNRGGIIGTAIFVGWIYVGVQIANAIWVG